MEESACSNCFYGERNGTLVKCKRFPPIGSENTKTPIDYQPNTKATDWCGEHKDK